MTPIDVVTHYGSKIKVAAAVGVSITTVENWLKRGKLNKLTQLAIQTLTEGALKAEVFDD